MDREELLKNLMELDFIAVDLALYLNTHPSNTEAIEAYNQVVVAADTVRMRYEENFGPISSFRSYDTDPEYWQWVSNPWPWQASANISFAGKECQ